MEGKLFRRTCAHCGAKFYHSRSNKRLCPECEGPKSKQRRSRQETDFKPTDIPLHRLLYLMEKYNTENKTYYTYGQFVALIHSGEIKIKGDTVYELENRSDT